MEKSDPEIHKSRSHSSQSHNAIPKKTRISSDNLSFDPAQRGNAKRSLGNDFVYVNHAYVGSASNVNEIRLNMPQPPTSVVREQYWACAKWPAGQRFLAIAVGLLLGTVIGLAVTVAIRKPEDNLLSDFFRSRPAPD